MELKLDDTFFSMTSFKTGWKSTITSYERTGRDSISSTLDQLLKPEAKVKNITYTQITEPIDLIVELENDEKIGIEVKCWNYYCTYAGSKVNQISPSFMLKEDKLKRMEDYVKKNNIDYILYAAILDGKIYYYNLQAIDWKNTYKYNTWQKKVQSNPNSEWGYQMTYYLKLDDAYKVIDSNGKN